MVIQLWVIQVSTPDYYLVDGGKFKRLTSGLDQFPKTPDTFLGQTTNQTQNEQHSTTPIIPFPLNPDWFRFWDPYFMA